jgi:DNA polymerase-3 subunit epsilon
MTIDPVQAFLDECDLTDDHEIDHATATLTRAGYRVLAPFEAGARTYDDRPLEDPADEQIAVIADVETTGDDVTVDEIVQVALLRVHFDARRGTIRRVDRPWTALEEPKRPISAGALAVHGITPEQLAGRPRITDAEILAVVRDARLLIAHKAAFDAPILVRRFPLLRAYGWGCSIDDIPWRTRGLESARLGSLLQDHTNAHFRGHDAGRDVAATAHVLATPFENGQTPFELLLTSALAPRVRIIAHGAPFEVKDQLSVNGYRWNDPTKAGARFKTFKAWFTECLASDADERMRWLAQTAYGSVLPESTPARVVALDPATRFLA